MSTKERIQNDLKDAMRQRDDKRRDTLRLITSAIKQVEVDQRISVDDEMLLSILNKMAKQRKESITQYQLAGRTDLVDQEQYELVLINSYLPQPLSLEEVSHIIDEAFAELQASQMSEMGKVMAYVKPKLQGRADMALVSSLIKSKLH